VSKVFFWIVVMPLAAAVIVFSVNNRADVVLDLWPLDMVTQPLPVFSVVLAGLFAGFLIGGLVVWISGGKARRRARREGHRADRAEREIKEAEPSSPATTCPGSPMPRPEGDKTPQTGVPARTGL